MRFEQQIGHHRGLHLVRPQVGKARLRVLAGVGVGPAIERVFLAGEEEIGYQPVAELIPLLDDRVEIAGGRLKGEGGRIARSRGERRLRRAVAIKALDRCLRLGLDPEIPRRADTDEQTAVARIDGNVPVGVPRSMKMGTIRSLCPYDAATPYALQSANLRRPAILRYATWRLLPDFAGWFGYLR